MRRLFAGLFLLCSIGYAQSEVFSFSGVDLNGKRVSEEKLNSRAAVLIVIFPQVQAPLAADWLALLEKNVKRTVQIASLVMGKPKDRLFLRKKFLKKTWSQVWIVPSVVMKQMELPIQLDQPYLLIVDPTGDIVDSVLGPANQENLDRVLDEIEGTMVVKGMVALC